MCFPWGAYLGEEGQRQGIRAMVSSWRRVGPNTIPHAAKATGVYLNSMLATHEARRRGLRRGDPAHRGRRTSPTAPERRSSWSRTATIFTPDLSVVDPAGDHARHDHPDQPGPRLHRRREDADPHRSLHRGRGVHDRDRRRGDAAPRDRRPRDRGRARSRSSCRRHTLDTVHGRSERWPHWLDYATRDPRRGVASASAGSRAASRRSGAGRRPSAPSRSAGRGPRSNRPAETRAAVDRARARRRAGGASASRAGATRCPRPRARAGSAPGRSPASSGSTTMQVSQQLLRP